MNISLLAGPDVSTASVVVDKRFVPILLVDDNPAKRLALKAVLLPLGYPIVEAESGLGALRCLLERNFAVILLDVRMPGIDGFETAALIRERRQSEMTPIIFITSHGKEEVATTDLYAEGAVDFIFAPVPPQELRAKVSVFANLFIRAEALAARALTVQTSADRLKVVIDATPIGIFQVDAERRYVYTNPRWAEITGITCDEAEGQPWDHNLDLEKVPGTAFALDDGAPGMAEMGQRLKLRTPGGPPRTLLVTSKAITNTDGEIAGWVGTVADVSTDALVEDALSTARDEANEASRMKSDFLANMSHEIRTPMNGVIGMTDLLLETDLDARQRDYAQTVRNSGEALLTIINDILDFSKVESGTFELEDIEFGLRTIVEDVVDLLAGPAQAKGLELVAVIERSVPSIVRGDPGRVRQVLTNLVGNAIKFTRSGEIVVRVKESEAVGGESLIRFEVSDTGDGIPAEKLSLIFQPFIQADTSTSRKYGGTGLGLAISGQLVALMGGDCGVTSTQGVGSEFWFTVAVKAHAGQARKAISDPDLADIAVLIVDDNPTQREVLSDYLTDWGMAVSTADSGHAALDMLRIAVAQGRPFDIALLDRFMPGMDGMDLADSIGLDAVLTTGLVVMNGLGLERDLENAAQSGVLASLSKPIHQEELRDCLRIALGSATKAVVPAGMIQDPSSVEGPQRGWLLLAEDNLINQKVAVAMLSSAGYRVDTVPDGAEAVIAAAARTYDAILMDCHMPEMNGYEATAAIRAQEDPQRHTPIIAMTAGARREDRERCLAEGMDSYLAKPVSKDALLALVAQSVKEATALIASVSADGSTADDAILDRTVFDELRALGGDAQKEFLTDIVAQFISDTDPVLVEMRDLFDAGDAAAVSRLAHSIKGSCSQLGGQRLSSSCTRLEEASNSDSLSTATTALAAVETDHKDLCQALAQQLVSVNDR
ncbi:MAG: two-component system, sensor histidine kinase and response regulator [Actinomycetota bacterium]|jgi:PAS domain S-box-containing protein|nr:two-component system, sensor histidine kinase and response regulator [Actinomycetota bacterium]